MYWEGKEGALVFKKQNGTRRHWHIFLPNTGRPAKKVGNKLLIFSEERGAGDRELDPTQAHCVWQSGGVGSRVWSFGEVVGLGRVGGAVPGFHWGKEKPASFTTTLHPRCARGDSGGPTCCAVLETGTRHSMLTHRGLQTSLPLLHAIHNLLNTPPTHTSCHRRQNYSISSHCGVLHLNIPRYLGIRQAAELRCPEKSVQGEGRATSAWRTLLLKVNQGPSPHHIYIYMNHVAYYNTILVGKQHFSSLLDKLRSPFYPLVLSPPFSLNLWGEKCFISSLPNIFQKLTFANSFTHRGVALLYRLL